MGHGKHVFNREGKVGSGTIAAIVALLVVGAFCYWAFLRGEASAKRLLAKKDLTPDEIRLVAEMLLAHDDEGLRGQALKHLGTQGDKAVPVLSEIAEKTDDSTLQFAVFGVLSYLDEKESVEVLGKLIVSPKLETRMEVVSIASKMNSPSAAPVLIKALEDENMMIRSTAAGALGPTGAREAIAPLRKALMNDPEKSVRAHAARSLKDLTGQDYRRFVDEPTG
jgi:HEAT repeat protein